MKKTPYVGCHSGVEDEAATLLCSPEAKFFQSRAGEVQKVIDGVVNNHCEVKELIPYVTMLNGHSVLNLLDEGPEQDVGSVVAFVKAQLKVRGVKIKAETPVFARY